LKVFLTWVDQNNTKTQQEMADYASQLVGQQITRFIVSRTLKKQEVNRKKISYHYFEQDQAKIDEFERILYPLLDLPILALDETSLPLNLAPRYGYAKRGSRVNSQKTGKRGNSYTLILCIANVEKYGVVLYQLTGGGVDAGVFHDFLSHEKISSENRNYLIMDNVRIHHATHACRKLGLSTIKELLESKNIEPVYLPPYTPELNPTELCFNFIKGQMGKYQPQTFEELEIAVEKVLTLLHEKDMTKYFQHCSEYFSYKQKPKEGYIKLTTEDDKKK
jgi:transposase